MQLPSHLHVASFLVCLSLSGTSAYLEGAPLETALQDPGPKVPAEDPREALRKTLAQADIHLNFEHQAVSTLARIEVTDQLLEYLAVLPHGAAHEAMLVLGGQRAPEDAVVWAEFLNTAILALGLEPGQNARWVEKDPAPSQDELRQGVSAYDVFPPEGDGLFLYLAWRVGEERYIFRLEDLIRDLERGRAMRRHPWVYLGSRMVDRGPDEPEAFAAGLEGNLINISFFAQGNTLITGALEECVNQTTWLPNAWILPPTGSDVLMIFASKRLNSLPESIDVLLPGGE
jgi:hypothetical protein